MALHEQSVGKTDEWFTPPHVFAALGCSFDMDVAHPEPTKALWVPARQYLCASSLESDWRGFVWMNPPFGKRNGIEPWLEKFFKHGDGVALTPDRTSAPWWQRYAARADVILFVSPKLKFISADGTEGRSPAQGTTLMAVGEKGSGALRLASKTLGLLLTPEGKTDGA